MESLETLIIDEVSMVDANLLDVVERYMRRHGRDPNASFGGTRVVLFGDPFQLPPVVATKEAEQYLAANYASRYFFDSRAFRDGSFRTIELTTQYRHLDPEWASLLNAVRTGRITSDHLATLQARYDPSFLPDGDEHWLTLTTTNARAAEINDAALDRLSGKERKFEAVLEGRLPSADTGLPAELLLRLRVGARVMFIRNDQRQRWMNGTFGQVTDIGDEHLCVRVLSGPEASTYRVERETWEQYAYKYDTKRNRIDTQVVGRMCQFPIRLAWAVTIHKSQGQTLDRVILDFESGLFEHGQGYVALSRCRTKERIVFRRPVSALELRRCDPRVQEFMNEVERVTPSNVAPTGSDIQSQRVGQASDPEL